MDKRSAFLKKMPVSWWIFAVFYGLFVVLMVFVEKNNGRFWTNDFRVYYEATQDYFFHGNYPYQHAYGLETGFFKYPPTTLYFFLPVSSLPYEWAQLVHTVLLGMSFLIAVFQLQKLFFRKVEPLKNENNGLLWLSFALIVIHMVREFHLGNVNLFLLALFVSGMNGWVQGKEGRTAVFWSFMVILKPIVVLTFIPLLFLKKWKMIAQMALMGFVFFFVPVIFSGISGDMELWKTWFEAVAHHGDYIVSSNSLTYLAEFYLGWKSAWMPSLLLLVVLTGVLLFSLRKKDENPLFLAQWSSVYLAFTPNFFVTDTEHFLLTLPLLVLLTRELIIRRKGVLWAIFVLILLPFSLNSSDLLGKASDFVGTYGLLGISNLSSIVFYLLMKYSSKNQLIEV